MVTTKDHANYFNNIVFFGMTDGQKNRCTLEYLYISTIDNHLIPEHVLTGHYPPLPKWRMSFMKELMNLLAEDGIVRREMREFASKNIEELMNKYNPQFFQAYMLNENRGGLKIKSGWKESLA